MTLTFREIISRLTEGGIETPDLEVRLILSALSGIEPSLISLRDGSVPSEFEDQILQIISQRLKHKPLCKILGEKGFYKQDFIVNNDVLSPRPDTEILVEAAIGTAQKNDSLSVLDLGTGSGCILLSILADCPTMRGVGVDISPAALAVAATNAEHQGLKKRVEFLNLDWFEKDFVSRLDREFDLIVSNPPYIPTTEIADLEDEVKNYDPLAALDGGNDGLDSYRRLAEIVPFLLLPGGSLLLEVGEGQAETVRDLFVATGLEAVDILFDYGGIKRCVILKKLICK